MMSTLLECTVIILHQRKRDTKKISLRPHKSLRKAVIEIPQGIYKDYSNNCDHYDGLKLIEKINQLLFMRGVIT